MVNDVLVLSVMDVDVVVVVIVVMEVDVVGMVDTVVEVVVKVIVVSDVDVVKPVDVVRDVDVVVIVSELTDDEVEAEPEQWKELVDGMVEEGLVELLAGNLTRFNESTDSDRNGVYHTLSTCPGTARERS